MKILYIGTGPSYADERELTLLYEACRNQYREAKVERLDAESRESVGLLEAYDIMQIPAVLITQDDGKPIAIWQHRLPTMDEIGHAMQIRA